MKDDVLYVYIDHRGSDDVPFYVGIGSWERVLRKRRNQFHTNICVKYGAPHREVILSSKDSQFIYDEERRLIHELNTFNGDNPEGANMTRGGEVGPRGMKHSSESRLKMSLKRKGRPLTVAHREAIGKSHKGKPKSHEQRMKLSSIQKGRKVNRTLEHQAKLDKAQIGKAKPSELRLKISNALKGRKLSPEHKMKIADGMRGKKRGPYKKRIKQSQDHPDDTCIATESAST